MRYIQIKAIRKGTKPPVWRRILLPAGITFAQAAVILETALELPLTDQYEFEFYHEGDRLIEWDRRKNLELVFPVYTYHNAVKAAVDDWLMEKTWLTFRIRGSEELPQYRVETESLMEADGERENSKLYEEKSEPGVEPEPSLYPVIMKEISYKEDPHWSDPKALNEKLRDSCFLTEGEADYPSFASVCERVRQGKGISFCQNIESIDNTEQEFLQEVNKATEDKIAQLNKRIAEIEKKLAELKKSGEGGRDPEADNAGTLNSDACGSGADHSDTYDPWRRESDYPKLTRKAPKLKAATMDAMFKAYTKEDLAFAAEECGAGHLVKGRKTKAKLAYELARYLLEPAVMRGQLLQLSEYELDAFESAIGRKRFFPSDEEFDELTGAFELYYLAEFSDDSVEVPEDAAAVYEIIRRNGYRDFHRKARWLIDCLNAFALLYIVGKVSILYRLYCRDDRFGGKREEFDSILAQIPEMLNPCRKIGKNIVACDALREDLYERLEEYQRDVPWYIPSKEEILDYSVNGYPSSDEAYRKLSDFYGRELKLNASDCGDLCSKAFRIFSTKGMLSDYMEYINEKDIVFDTTEQGERFVRLVMDLNNTTRMWEFRGHTPAEFTEFAVDGPADRRGGAGNAPAFGRTKIIPMSSEAAGLLDEVRSEIGAMGFDVDLKESAADIPVMSMPNGLGGEVKTGTRKIYPNDPCPCGSGKKYKKCCGRGK